MLHLNVLVRKVPFKKNKVTEKDYVIVCGDFGLLWSKDRTFEYHLRFFQNLPFTTLWVSGNHENYNMIEEYSMENWHGGLARHILRDKVILLERGQIFHLVGKSFFTFGGASSHDVQGGILDRNDPDFIKKRKEMRRLKLAYRILDESWWAQELPSEEEMQTGIRNLENVRYHVDYVISHCLSGSMQKKMGMEKAEDVLTQYFDKLEEKLKYKHWYCGHYHKNLDLDEKHTILYSEIRQAEEKSRDMPSVL